jgi:signal transduction histidine kinase
MRNKDIRLAVACPEKLSVVTDERMLATILRNLVSNAVKFSPRGSTIQVRAQSPDLEGAVHISVADEGVGMSPELAVHLFTSNMGHSKAGTAGEKGNGLGLMFSAQLAVCMGARLEVSSAPGQGSLFTLTLPDVVEGDLHPEV